MSTHRFHTQEPIELDVRIPSGDVTVETVDGDESFVELEGDERLVDETTVELQGNRLLIELRTKKAFGFSIEIGGWSWGNDKLRVRARVPHSSTLSFTTASADVQALGRLGELDATIKTVSGDAHLETVCGALKVQTVSGDLFVDDVHEDVSVKSVSGDVRIGAAHGREATLQSVSGDIELGVAAGLSVDVDANSVSGDLESEVPLGSDPSAAAGDGHTLVVRGKTVSGDFRLVRG